jgi:hypothetical protein
VLLLSILLVSSSIDDVGTGRDGGIGATIIVVFVGVKRGRGGCVYFTGSVVEDDGNVEVAPLTTAAIVSEIAKNIY